MHANKAKCLVLNMILFPVPQSRMCSGLFDTSIRIGHYLVAHQISLNEFPRMNIFKSITIKKPLLACNIFERCFYFIIFIFYFAVCLFCFLGNRKKVSKATKIRN